MKLLFVYLTILFAALVWSASANDEDDKNVVKKLQIGIKKRVSEEKCSKKSRKGDTLHMQYRGTLYADRNEKEIPEFDSSYSRNQPFVFVLGTGQVIRGWDQGLLGMCEGEERKLVVPSDMAYGSRGAPPKIPANAALVFDVVLEKIERHQDL